MIDLLLSSLKRLERWIEEHDYKAYEPFDGLSSPLRPLTFGTLLGDRLLLQLIRQSPINLRPLLGVKPLPSTKGRGYMAAGYLLMHRLTGDQSYQERAEQCLRWLIQNKSPKFKEFSWANHFDFASRSGRYTKHESIIVWTSLIGMAFLDAYEQLGKNEYLDVAESACRWILNLPRERTESGTCISYLATTQSSIHNSNMLGAAMLARCGAITGSREFIDLADDAMLYSCSRQLSNGAWYYGEQENNRWIDNFHTGYNLDSLKTYIKARGDDKYRNTLIKGLHFYKNNFFTKEGVPKYYHNRTYPIDSQCASQSIETLANFAEIDYECLDLAKKVANWAINTLQDKTGYFYYRIYPLRIFAKTPMFHWAQATMYKALSLLLCTLEQQKSGEATPSP